MNHTFLSIANACNVSKDQVKYAYRKLETELGQVVKGTRTFTDDERDQIVKAGNFDPLSVALSTEVVIEDCALDAYDPAAFMGALTTYQAGDDSALIEKGNEALNYLQTQATASSNAGINALIASRRNNGRKLGAMLAQVELGTALQEEQAIKAQFFQSQGLTAE